MIPPEYPEEERESKIRDLEPEKLVESSKDQARRRE